jgi:hypothetical protein
VKTLVIDTGQDIVGIFSVEENSYTPYRGDDITTAIQRIQAADQIITYNGKLHDLWELGKFSGTSGQLLLSRIHVDMRSVCWSDDIFGSNLCSTYSMHFPECPDFPDTYEGSNERDCYLTFKLWQAWKSGELKVLNGEYQVSQKIVE